MSPAFLLLHLLRKDWVLHSSTQYSKEEGGEEGAEAECHPGNGVGHHHFLPLPVYRLHDLIGQDGWPHAVAHLPGDDCGITKTLSVQHQDTRHILYKRTFFVLIKPFSYACVTMSKEHFTTDRGQSGCRSLSQQELGGRQGYTIDGHQSTTGHTLLWGECANHSTTQQEKKYIRNLYFQECMSLKTDIPPLWKSYGWLKHVFEENGNTCNDFSCVNIACASYHSHVDRLFGLEAASLIGVGSEALMKVWLMVLTTIPYSSTSALRQSKKAWAACLEAASDRCAHRYPHMLTWHPHDSCTKLKEVWLVGSPILHIAQKCST